MRSVSLFKEKPERVSLVRFEVYRPLSKHYLTESWLIFTSLITRCSNEFGLSLYKILVSSSTVLLPTLSPWITIVSMTLLALIPSKMCEIYSSDKPHPDIWSSVISNLDHCRYFPMIWHSRGITDSFTRFILLLLILLKIVIWFLQFL